jgi:hypothetical protein
MVRVLKKNGRVKTNNDWVNNSKTTAHAEQPAGLSANIMDFLPFSGLSVGTYPSLNGRNPRFGRF